MARMLSGVMALVCACATVAAQNSAPQLVYAGFEHVIVVDPAEVTATAFDYRRQLPKRSTCDRVAQPPLLHDVPLEDWVSKGARDSQSTQTLAFTHLGYEIFLTEHKVTGSWVARRCRDFRPHLTKLPCEAFATGTSELFKAPYTTVFIGNNRIMVVNSQTGQFSVFPFDADVHSGGDPFHFSSGALISGVIPVMVTPETSFAYVQLRNNSGDMLIVHQKDSTMFQGLRFNGIAASPAEWTMVEVLKGFVPAASRVATLGENQIVWYDNQLNFHIWEIAFNQTRLVSKPLYHGNVKQGHNCEKDSATECVMTDGCAWCPTSKTCHSYDMANGAYCDNHACDEPAVTDSSTAALEDMPPDCNDENDHDAVDAIRVEPPDHSGLAGDTRLPPTYRKDEGEFEHVVVSPIDSQLDGQLGDDMSLGEKDPNAISEVNRVSQGQVYRPPPPHLSTPCMDKGYDANKGMETSASWKMNKANNEAAVSVEARSPLGEARLVAREDCIRNAGAENKTATEQFKPLQGDPQKPAEEFVPESTSTLREEDTMNGDLSKFSSLKSSWMGEAQSTDNTLALKKLDSEVQFLPKEPKAKPRMLTARGLEESPYVAPPATAEDQMNMGLRTDGLAGANFDAGGADGKAVPTFNEAMLNSANPVPGMPKTIEQHLQLFKDEPKNVVDFMPNPPPEALSLWLPPAPAHDQYFPKP